LRRYLLLALAAVLAGTIGAGHLQQLTSDRDALAQRDGLRVTDIGLVAAADPATPSPGVCAVESAPNIPGPANANLDGVQSPGGSGTYQLVALQAKAEFPGSRKCFVVYVRVVGKANDPTRPTATPSLDPTDFGFMPEVSAEGNPVAGTYQVTVKAGRASAGCTSAEILPGAKPTGIRVVPVLGNLGNAGDAFPTISADKAEKKFTFTGADDFTVKFTCYRP
jgi:hypothetical protein